MVLEGARRRVRSDLDFKGLQSLTAELTIDFEGPLLNQLRGLHPHLIPHASRTLLPPQVSVDLRLVQNRWFSQSGLHLREA